LKGKEMENYSKETIKDVNNCYVPAEGDIVAGCIDGRCGCRKLWPNSAGGSLSLYVAARLSGAFDGDEKEFFAKFAGTDMPLGTHTDQHANDTKTGCGASDRIGEILNIIADEDSRQEIFNQMKSLELGVDIQVLEKMGEVAASLTLGTPRERLTIIEDAGGEVEELTGDHEEEEVLVNFVPGTTLDRNQSAGKAFNVDAWAFEPSARATLTILGQPADTEAIDRFVTALTAFNLATGKVLNPTAKIKARRG
jgi:hypothetical protein